MKDLMSLEMEFKNLPTPLPENLLSKASDMKQKENKLVIECRKKFDEWQDRIRQKTEDIGGICENCTKFYDSKNKDFIVMKSKLDSFTMPF